eukprot:m.879943 g.879943  ORF g.879943 m.879943 type:complete len:201 (+) comp23588_c0_seq6:2749-3351(+)
MCSHFVDFDCSRARSVSPGDAVRFLQGLLAIETVSSRRGQIETFLQGFREVTPLDDSVMEGSAATADVRIEHASDQTSLQIMESIMDRITQKDEAKTPKIKRILHRRSKSDVLDQLLLVEHMGDDSDLAGLLTDHEACDDVIRGSLEFDSLALTPPVGCSTCVLPCTTCHCPCKARPLPVPWAPMATVNVFCLLDACPRG